MTDPAGKRVCVDSNILIYAVEGVPATAGPARELIRFLRAHRGLMFTSEIALAEVLAPSKRRGAWPLAAKRRAYLDLLIWSGAVTLVPVTRDILIRTADLRKTTPLKLPDAIHLMSAIFSKCRFLVTGDADFKKLPSSIKQVKPDEQGIQNLLRVLA
ncbi:MAG: type II toxin-antitoxin system VapC family toxin [Xanthobacteraceae bacterium]